MEAYEEKGSLSLRERVRVRGGDVREAPCLHYLEWTVE
jgi:hypothetical protein